MNSLLQVEKINKNFGQVAAVRDLSLEISSTDFLAIIGRSGSGKTTTLNLLSGLESPDSGSILFNGKDISPLNEDSLALWRRTHVGLVFQAFHLIPTLSASENVAFPLYPTSVTVKERQKLAITRALINNPNLILADEPTGNLDSETGNDVMQLLRKLNLEENVAVVIITHDPEVAAEADRVIEMKDGKIVNENRSII